MEVNRLAQDELYYELEIRGLPLSSVDDMRVTYRAALKTEKAGKEVLVKPYPYDFKTDKEALEKKLVEINKLLEVFDGISDGSEFRKIATKIEWALGRQTRMVTSSSEEVREKSRIRAELVIAYGHLHAKAEGESLEDAHDSDDDHFYQSITGNLGRQRRSYVPIYKWNIKFSGAPGESLNSFLERVQELSDSRNVSMSQLFRSGLDLFAGRALIWYRANKNRINSLPELVLRKEFLPPDYEDRLMDEIRKRTQGKEETMGTYVAIMLTMFSRLSVPIDEERQLKILKGNIAPFYQTQIGISEVTTIQNLIELGRKLERVRVSVEAYIPPPRKSSHLLELDLAYVSTTSNQVASLNSSKSGIKYTCKNCKKDGHTAKFCRQPLNLRRILYYLEGKW